MAGSRAIDLDGPVGLGTKALDDHHVHVIGNLGDELIARQLALRRAHEDGVLVRSAEHDRIRACLRVLPRVLALDVDASRLVPVMLDDADADPHVREQAHDAGDKRRLAGIGPSGHRYDWYSTHGRSLHIVRKALC